MEAPRGNSMSSSPSSTTSPPSSSSSPSFFSHPLHLSLLLTSRSTNISCKMLRRYRRLHWSEASAPSMEPHPPPPPPPLARVTPASNLRLSSA